MPRKTINLKHRECYEVPKSKKAAMDVDVQIRNAIAELNPAVLPVTRRNPAVRPAQRTTTFSATALALSQRDLPAGLSIDAFTAMFIGSRGRGVRPLQHRHRSNIQVDGSNPLACRVVVSSNSQEDLQCCVAAVVARSAGIIQRATTGTREDKPVGRRQAWRFVVMDETKTRRKRAAIAAAVAATG
jgi:hypothetical protein